MNFKQVWTVWLKEVKDTIRDRRTLMSMLILPIFLMPALIVGIGKFAQYQTNQAEQKPISVAFSNSEAAPELVSFFKNQDKINVVEVSGDLTTAIRDKKADAGLEIPVNFNFELARRVPVKINLIHTSTNGNDSLVLSRVTTAVASYNNSVLVKRFSQQKINPAILTGLSLNPQDTATEKERGGFFLGFLIPLLIVMWSIIGGQYTAIDVSAGEKERKTLEPLLMTPINRLSLVTGKFLSVATASLVSVLASLGSLYFAVNYFGLASTKGLNTGQSVSASSISISLDPQALIIILLVSVLLVLMFAAIILSLGIFAKSYREAQSYISPAYLVIILPIVLVNSLQGFVPGNWFFAIPAINAVLLFKELLLGVYSLPHIVITTVSLLVFSVLAILVATVIYSKENILFNN